MSIGCRQTHVKHLDETYAARRRTNAGDRCGSPPQPRARHRRQRRRLRRDEVPAARRAGGRARSIALVSSSRASSAAPPSVRLLTPTISRWRRQRVCGSGRDRRPGGREVTRRRSAERTHGGGLRLLLRSLQMTPLEGSAAPADGPATPPSPSFSFPRLELGGATSLSASPGVRSRSYSVVGVAPPRFRGLQVGRECDVWIALSPPRRRAAIGACRSLPGWRRVRA